VLASGAGPVVTAGAAVVLGIATAAESAFAWVASPATVPEKSRVRSRSLEFSTREGVVGADGEASPASLSAPLGLGIAAPVRAVSAVAVRTASAPAMLRASVFAALEGAAAVLATGAGRATAPTSHAGTASAAALLPASLLTGSSL
jgi:hypothetical protein